MVARAAATVWRPTSMSDRLDVRKTYKLYIGGAFPRSESGRSYEVTDTKGRFLANASLASRKDARDAVVAARKAFPAWSTATPYNRGQVIYRVAEMLEGRRGQFVTEIAEAEGINAKKAGQSVDLSVDRLVWYAGWADKHAQVLGGSNPVAGPFFNFSVPEPTGVVAVLAPQDSSLLGLVSCVAPVIATGNTCVVLAAGDRPLPRSPSVKSSRPPTYPGGVVNILTGRVSEVAPHLAAHMDVNAIDLTGAGDASAELEGAAADNVKRVLRPRAAGEDWAATPDLRRLRAFVETKTVWHPVGV